MNTKILALASLAFIWILIFQAQTAFFTPGGTSVQGEMTMTEIEDTLDESDPFIRKRYAAKCWDLNTLTFEYCSNLSIITATTATFDTLTTRLHINEYRVDLNVLGDANITGDLNVLGDSNFTSIGVAQNVWLDGDIIMESDSASTFKISEVDGNWVINAEVEDADDTGLILATGYEKLIKLGMAAGHYSSVAIGANENNASGESAVAIGDSAEALGQYSIAAGLQSIARGLGSVTIGYHTEADGIGSVALGRYTYSTGEGSVTAGYGKIAGGIERFFATGDGAVALGYGDVNHAAEGRGSVALGYNCIAKGEASICLGKDLTNYNANSVLIQDLNALGDANFVDIGFSSFIYGNGSKLTGLQLPADANNFFVQLQTAFDWDTNAQTACTNYADILGGTGLCIDLNINRYLASDINTHFAPILSPNILGDANFVNLEADYFFGDGSGITDVISTADVNGEDVILNWVDIDGNLSVAGDANFSNVQADYFYGDGSGLTNVTSIGDVNGDDIHPSAVNIDRNLSVIGDTNLANAGISNIFGGNYYGTWTEGSILFAGEDRNIYQNNSNLFWSDSNTRLGIGMNLGFDTTSTGLSVTGDIDIIHTAITNNDHAFDIDINAAGFGDIKAIEIGYTTGAIVAGEDEAIILINIDESSATGGDVIGIEILATEGAATIYGLEAGILVNPIVQLSGVFGNMDSATVSGVDKLTEFTSTASDITIFDADDDNITIGNDDKFEEIEFLLDTVANPGIAPTFEYSTGIGTWTAFFPTDGTNELKHNGVIAWQDEDIPAWATGFGGKYIIRITRTKNNLASTPKEDKIQISSATKYEWDKDGDLSVRDVNAARNIQVLGDLNVVGDINFGGTLSIEGIGFADGGIIASGDSNFFALEADYFFGDGSGLENVTSTGDVNGDDIHPSAVNIDNNLSVLGDSNFVDIGFSSFIYGDGSKLTGLQLPADANNFFLQIQNAFKYDSNADTACTNYSDILGGTGVCFDLNVNRYLASDVNTHFLGYNGATTDLNLGTHDLNTAGDIQAENFYGDGSGLTGITATSGWPVDTTIDSNQAAFDSIQVDMNLMYCLIPDSNDASRLSYAVIADPPWQLTADANNFFVQLQTAFDWDTNAQTACTAATEFLGGTGLCIDVNTNRYMASDINGNFAPILSPTFESDVNIIASGTDNRVSIEPDFNRIWLGNEMYIDYNGTSITIGG